MELPPTPPPVTGAPKKRPIWLYIAGGVASLLVLCCAGLLVLSAIGRAARTASPVPSAPPVASTAVATSEVIQAPLTTTAPEPSEVPTEALPVSEVPTEAPTVAAPTEVLTVEAPTEVPTVEAPTEVPAPLPADPVPLTVEGVTPLLIQPGDLPEGWTGDDDVFNDPHVDYDGPPATVVLNQGLNAPGDRLSSGNVVLMVFETQADAEKGYTTREALIRRVVEPSVVFKMPLIGDVSLLAPPAGSFFVSHQLLFRRCNAVVEIDLGDATHEDWITTYGSALDRRLQAGICR